MAQQSKSTKGGQDTPLRAYRLRSVKSLQPKKPDPAVSLNGLVDSLKEYGQILPAVEDANGFLLKGKRVLAAAKENGFTNLVVRRLPFKGAEAKMAVLDATFVHGEHSPIVEAELLADWQKIYEEKHPLTKKGGNWKAKSQNDKLSFSAHAARRTSRDERTIQRLLRIAKSLPKEFRSKLKPTGVGASQSELLELCDMEEKNFPHIPALVERLAAHPHERLRVAYKQVCRDADLIKPEALATSEYDLWTGDFRSVMKDFKDHTVDLVCTDIPWGKQYLDLAEPFAKESERVLKSNGTMLVTIGQVYLPEVLEIIRQVIPYHWMLIQLFKPPSSSPLWQHKVDTQYKPILWFQKGEYPHDVLYTDIIQGTGKEKRYHDWQQPLPGFEWQILHFSKPGDRVLDPFMGSGTTAVAALKHGRKFWGIDIDEQWTKVTKIRIQDEVFNGEDATEF